MSVTLFYRNHKAGFSIKKVFDIIYPYLHNSIKYEVPSNRDMPWSVIRNLIYIYKHRNKNGINHITGDIHYGILALWGCKSVLTIHDLVMIYNSRGVKRYLKGLFWIKIPIKLASHITCISERTKLDVIRYTRCNKDKITVIPNAFPDNYNYVPAIKGRKILHIGTRPNKNLKRVIQSLQEIDCHLRIVGKIDESIHNLLEELNIDYSVVSNLSDEEIKQEYINCNIVSFPSLFEGFGMPIIEGQAIGRVVVTSNISPMNEIANSDNAILVDPYSVESIREGFIKALNNDDYRAELEEKGLENVMNYRSGMIAERYNNLYKALI